MNKDHRSKSLLTAKPKEAPVLLIKPPIIDINQQKFENQSKHQLRNQISQVFQKSGRIKNQEYNSNIDTSQTLNQEIDVVQTRLKKIFEYYCQYGERMNVLTIKSQKYYKLMCDANVACSRLNKTRIELIFSSENKHKPQMNYEIFLSSLIKIAEAKFINENLSQGHSLQKLIKEFILPLYDVIFEKGNQINTLNNQMSSSNLNNESLMDKSSIIICNNEIIFENDTIELISMISPVLFNVYQAYFPFELSLNEEMNFILEKSQKEYFSFLKDFEIWPSMISKSMAFQIFQQELNYNLEVSDMYMKMIERLNIPSLKKYSTKNFLGQFFNYFKFLRSLSRIAELSFERLEINVQRKLSLFEKITLLCERMELSTGFQSFELKTSKTHSVNSSKLIPNEVIDQVKFNIFENDQNLNILDDDQLQGSSTQKSISRIKKSIYGNHDKFNFEYSEFIIENYGNDLLNIFKYYCSFGDPMNTQFMKITKFNKFLKEAGLIKANKTITYRNQYTYINPNFTIDSNNDYGIKSNEIDSIFIKISSKQVNPDNVGKSIRESMSLNNQTNTSFKTNESQIKGNSVNANSKVDFNIFINLIEYICSIIFPNKDQKESLTFLILNHILPLSQNIKNNFHDQLEFLLEKQSKPEILEILEIVKRAFMPIYKFYANPKTFLLNFELFFKFCVDFSIFPDFISKAKLNTYFKNISSCMPIMDSSDSQEQINEVYFVDLLALCAFELPFRDPQPSQLEKILFFVEKLSQSDGTNKILKNSGSTKLVSGESLDIILPFRQNYPDFFETKEVKKPQFFELLAEN